MRGADRRRILVVDHERTPVETIRERFAARFDVETVSSRSAALAALVVRRPDAVLLDDDLPGLTGRQRAPRAACWHLAC